jgi:uncharacterized protein YjiS (DUF1127 family)
VADRLLTEKNSTIPQPKTTPALTLKPTLTPDKCPISATVHAHRTMEAKTIAIENASNDARSRSHPQLKMWLGLIAALQQFIRLRRDRRILDGLPDYILRDIGINSSEIESITLYCDLDHTRRRP